MAGVSLGRPLKELACGGGGAPLHHPDAQFVQHRRMGGRELRHTCQQLIGLGGAASRARGPGGLNHPQYRAILWSRGPGRGIDVAQWLPLWFCSLRIDSSVAPSDLESALTAAAEVDFKLIRVASLLERDPAAAAREAALIV